MTKGLFGIQELLFDWLPFPALIHDRSTVLDLNREAVRRMKGTSADQFVGRPVVDLVHPHAREAGEARREMFEKGLHFRGVSTKLIAADGSEVHVTGCALPYRIGDTDLAIAVGMDLDCSERIYGASRGVQSYPHGHSSRAAALEAVPAGVVALRGFELVYVNTACTRLMKAGCPEDLVGRSVLEFVDDMMRETLRERFTVGVMNATVDYDSPGKIHAVDGTVIDLLTRGQMIEDGDNPLRVWVITKAEAPVADAHNGAST